MKKHIVSMYVCLLHPRHNKLQQSSIIGEFHISESVMGEVTQRQSQDATETWRMWKER